MPKDILPFIGGWPPNFIVTEVLGIVMGEGTQGTSIFKDTRAKVADIFGGKVVGYSEDLAKAKDEATREMLELARKNGADAVGGIEHATFIAASEKGGIFVVSTMGTAVKGFLKKDE